METVTKKYNVYTIEELTPEAQEKAHARWKQGNEYILLKEFMLDNLKEQLKKHKIKTEQVDVHYSFSYSQGDGAMFYGVFEWRKNQITIKHSGRYYHSNSKTIEIKTGKPEWEEYADDDVCEKFEKIYQTICKELERYGYDFIETEDSMENFKETCHANDYKFLENGEME